MSKINCAHIHVEFGLEPDHPAIDQIDEYLESNMAGAVYRRSKSEHLLLFAHREARDGGAEYRASWWDIGPEKSGFEPQGDAWAALELGFDAAQSAELNCTFGGIAGQVPKLSLPAAPFASGVFPFNQIHGYRLALVEDDQTVWSAIVDWMGPDEGHLVTIRVEEFALSGKRDARKIANQLRFIRDSLMTDADIE